MDFLDTKYLLGLTITLAVVFLITSSYEICYFGGAINYDFVKLKELCNVSSYNELMVQTSSDPSFCPERDEYRTHISSCQSSSLLITLSLLISFIIYTLIYKKFSN